MISALDKTWQEKAPISYAALQPPFTAEQFQALTTLTGNELPPAYREFFAWKGGQDALTENGLLPGWRIMQFTEITMEYQPMLELFNMGEFTTPNWWSPRWLPLLVNDAGETICYDGEGVFGGTAGQLIQFAADNPDRTIWFPDLQALFDAAVNAFETGAALQFPAGYPKAHRAG